MSSAPGSNFIISRIYSAPRSLLFACFTDSSHMRNWFSPTGFDVVKADMDFREGGVYHYGMKAPDGFTVWGKFIYREIVPPSKIVFITSFSDEKGGIARHPMSPTWPLEMLSTATFEEAGEGKSKLTIRWQAWNASAEEQTTFDTSHDSMKQGWTGTMDQLAAYLAKTES